MKGIFIKEVEEMSNTQLRKIMNWNNMIAKLSVKTQALWEAAKILQEKLEPNKTVDQVYEMLKMIGKTELVKKKPEVKKYIKF